MTVKEHKYGWFHGVFLLDGYGWGVREVGNDNIRELKSIRLGKEADVIKGLESSNGQGL